MNKILFLSGALLLAGCQPRANPRGNIMIADELDSFVVGKTTMSDVIQKCGTPSLHADDFTWIYFSAIAKETAFSDVSLQNRLVIKMIFDSNCVLRSIQKIKQPKIVTPMDKNITALTEKNKHKK